MRLSLQRLPDGARPVMLHTIYLQNFEQAARSNALIVTDRIAGCMFLHVDARSH
ncbi:hypothetical protein BDV96DRAFT_564889 [Lophiotrema nucula]|uniref:Uncharacterized protein n=1 Tax=Lophiotrema nucula TaxID=690887 RepID=A0A6A5ZMS7_9PLEO|nr:hypothetical protein BDV96DRAFT_564889 [Lophiotrema nucula]